MKMYIGNTKKMDNKIRLNNGNLIPQIAFGLTSVGYTSNMISIPQNPIANIATRAYRKFMIRPLERKKFRDSVVSALKFGYRLIDNSISYKNEELIKEAIKITSIPRSEIFLTSRASNLNQFNGTVKDEFFKMLERYGTDYIDLFQFHWPVSDHYLNTWHEMVDLYNQGYIKNLGVANCNIHHLKRLIESEGIVPAINQVEVHPLFTQSKLREYCNKKNIQVQSYSSIARCDDRLVRLPILKKIALKYNKTIIQVILRWHVQSGLIPIVRSSNLKRQQDNINIFDFKLTDKEVRDIDRININARVRYDPDNCDFTIL